MKGLKNAIRTNFDQDVDVLGGHAGVQYPSNGICIYNIAISGIFLLTALTATVCPRVSSHTEEPGYNQGPSDWQNMFAITRFRYTNVLFRIFDYYWGKQNL